MKLKQLYFEIVEDKVLCEVAESIEGLWFMRDKDFPENKYYSNEWTTWKLIHPILSPDFYARMTKQTSWSTRILPSEKSITFGNPKTFKVAPVIKIKRAYYKNDPQASEIIECEFDKWYMRSKTNMVTGNEYLDTIKIYSNVKTSWKEIKTSYYHYDEWMGEIVELDEPRVDFDCEGFFEYEVIPNFDMTSIEKE